MAGTSEKLERFGLIYGAREDVSHGRTDCPRSGLLHPGLHDCSKFILVHIWVFLDYLKCVS